MNPVFIPSSCRALFLDAVGTLIHPQPDAIEVYKEVGRRHGYLLDRSTLAHRFRQKFDEEERRDAATGWRVSEEREKQRWAAIVHGVFVESKAVEPIFRELWDHFRRPTAWQVSEDAAEVIASAKLEGLIVGVASNFDSRLHRILDGLPPLAGLQHRIISAEIGWRKPSGRFFEAVIHAANCLPEQIVFVGDRPDNDVAGAEAAGLLPILFSDRRSEKSPGRVIARLRDLL